MSTRSPARLLAVGDLHVTERNREDDQRAVLARIAADAEVLRPHLSLVLGDLYGHTVPHRSTPTERAILVPFVQALAKHGPVVVLVGNHDVPEDTALLASIASEWPITVVAEPELLRMTIRGGHEVLVAAMPYPRRMHFLAGDDAPRSAEASRQAMDAAIRDQLALWAHAIGVQRDEVSAAIFAGHATVRGARVGGGEVMAGQEPELPPALLGDLPIDVGLLGHIHLQQQVAPRCWYTGSPWPQDHGEREVKAYVVTDVGGTAGERPSLALAPNRTEVLASYPASDTARPTDVVAVRTGAPRLLTLTWRWGSPHGEEGGTPRWLEQPDATPLDVAGAHVRVRMHVQPQAGDACPVEAAIAPYREAALSLRVETIVETSVSVRAPEVSRAESLDDKVRAYWNTLTPGPAPELADAALLDLDNLVRDGAEPALARLAGLRASEL